MRRLPTKDAAAAISMRLRTLLDKQFLESRRLGRALKLARLRIKLLQRRQFLVLAELGLCTADLRTRMVSS
jgi:hypothetical protein